MSPSIDRLCGNFDVNPITRKCHIDFRKSVDRQYRMHEKSRRPEDAFIKIEAQKFETTRDSDQPAQLPHSELPAGLPDIANSDSQGTRR